jgi:hypothetical protein
MPPSLHHWSVGLFDSVLAVDHAMPFGISLKRKRGKGMEDSQAANVNTEPTSQLQLQLVPEGPETKKTLLGIFCLPLRMGKEKNF